MQADQGNEYGPVCFEVWDQDRCGHHIVMHGQDIVAGIYKVFVTHAACALNRKDTGDVDPGGRRYCFA